MIVNTMTIFNRCCLLKWLKWTNSHLDVTIMGTISLFHLWKLYCRIYSLWPPTTKTLQPGENESRILKSQFRATSCEMSRGVAQIPGRENHGNVWEVFVQGENVKKKKKEKKEWKIETYRCALWDCATQHAFLGSRAYNNVQRTIDK